MTAGIIAAIAAVIFWLGFAVGRVSTAARGQRRAPRSVANEPPAGTSGRPGPARERTEPHRAADTVVSSGTLDEWAERYHGAPVEDLALPPLPDPGPAGQLPRPRNVVWQPTAAAAAATALPTHATGPAAAVAGWYWHEHVRTEQELWGPRGIGGPWDTGSMAALTSARLDEMAPVTAARLAPMAAIAGGEYVEY